MIEVKVAPHEKFEGVYRIRLRDGTTRLGTRNLDAGHDVYGEDLVRSEAEEFRVWDAYRSKIAAAILKGLKEFPVTRGSKILYLGVASGTTASHLSDIILDEGALYGVEFAPRAMRELIDNLCARRANIYPILQDARFPLKYKHLVGKVDVIYCDVAQPDQARILADNVESFLKQDGKAMIALKSRSIDVTMEPHEVFKQELETLRRRGLRIAQAIRLEPYDKDHAMVLLSA